MSHKRITLCMIVRDEEACLRESVESCQADFDELVIVDTGSTDGTVALAEELGARVEHFVWCNDFSAARNYAADQCETDWVLTIDADEVLAPECRGAARAAVVAAPDNISQISPLLTSAHKPRTQHYASKLYRRSRCHWERPSHNTLVVDDGQSLRLPDLRLVHDRGRRDAEKRQQRNDQRDKMNESNFRRLTDENPADTRSAFYLAMTLGEAGKHDEALIAWGRYLEIGKWGEERYEARRLMADCYLALNQTDEAVRQLILAHETEPRRAEAAIDLGDMYAQGGAHLRAQFWYQVAAGLPAPLESGCCLFTTAECYGAWPYLRLAQLAKRMDAPGDIENYLRMAMAATDPSDTETVAAIASTRVQLTANVNSEPYWDELYAQGRDVGDSHRELFDRVAALVVEQDVHGALDVGAGTGELIDRLREQGIDASGVDFSGEAAARHDHITQDDALHLATVEDESREAVACLELLEHLDDPQLALSQMHRVLESGGLLVVSVPNEEESDKPLWHEHVRRYDESSLRAELEPWVDGPLTVYEQGWWMIAVGRKAGEGKAEVTVREPLTLDIYCGSAHEPWGPQSLVESGLRGAWKCVVYAGRLLAERGWRVRVYGDPGEQAGMHDGVSYLHHSKFDRGHRRDVVIANRAASLLDTDVNARACVYWHHDLSEGVKDYGKHHHHVFMTEWQRQWYTQQTGQDFANAIIIPEGVDTDIFVPREEREKRLLFAAQPQRGLGTMLDIWPRLRELLSDEWVLDVCGSFHTWRQERPDDPQREVVQNQLAAAAGVKMHGMIPEADLADIMGRATLLVYSGSYPETCCTLAIEAQAAGLPIVGRAQGALPETCSGDVGVLIEGDPQDAAWRNEFIGASVKLITDRPYWEACSEAARTEALLRYDWGVLADRWDDLLRKLVQ